MADFKPVVALPEEVDVRTGEEGDTPLFSARCKLFRFTAGEWKERGVGELRVLHRQEDGRVRVVMRRDQVRWDGRPFTGCPQDGFRMLYLPLRWPHTGPFGARKVAEAEMPR